MIYLTPVPGKLNYAEITCLPAFPASAGNAARERCLRQWTHSFLPYSQPEELGTGVVWDGWVYCEEVKKMRKQGVKKPPA